MMRKKISIVAKSSTNWENNQIIENAQQRGFEVEIRQFQNLNDIDAIKESLGEIIIWRSSDLDKIVDRNLFMHLMSEHVIINDSLMKFPALAHKYFQQHYIRDKTSLKTIPTFRFRSNDEVSDAISNSILRYPFIVKPNLGARGEGIILIKSEIDLNKLPENTYEYVFQNFIRNTGDYRVFVLGGKAIGIMKRVAKQGGYLNNFSKGGSVHAEQNEEIVEYLQKEAPRVAAMFDLKLCGIDFIYDEDEKVFKFLEVNTAPQWQGLQDALKRNITSEIIDYATGLTNRNEIDTKDLVNECYERNQSHLGAKTFHYNSRMYLWTRDNKYRQRLEAFKEKYTDVPSMLMKLEKNSAVGTKKGLHAEERNQYFEKYPNLRKYNDMLFKYLFAYTLYEIDLFEDLNKAGLIDEMVELANTLKSDSQALKTLSTFAINYLYLLRFFLRKTDRDVLDPTILLDTLKEFENELNDDNLDLYIYFATHCIIGESSFYYNKVTNNREIYLEMLKKVESIIHKKYFNITLDNKCEFLVCCKLVGYESFLDPIIKSESTLSLSPIDNYIVDTVNSETTRQEKKTFLLSEHRNVLYLMANIHPNIS